MNTRLLLLMLLLALAGARPAPAGPPVRIVKLPALQQLLARPDDTTYVVNFWATWCKPCLEELPAFEQFGAAHAQGPVRVVLISLDFASLLEKKVQPFVARQQFKSAVWLLNEPDANSYINLVDPSWSGALPFTLIFNNARHQRKAFERPLTRAELEAEVKTLGQ